MSARGSSSWMYETWGEPCQPDLVAIPIYPGGPKFQCDRRARPAFLQQGAVFMRWHYIVHTIGGYNCRPNTSNPSVKSNHSWATANDVNEATNPYRRDRLITDMPEGMVDEIEAIKTRDGVRVFRWGGHYTSVKDSMHYEIIATPEELSVGFRSEIFAEETPAHWPVVRRGAHGPAVSRLQQLLRLGNTTGKGDFGPRTEAAVRQYQTQRGLHADGIVGRATWTALLTGMPALASGEPSPIKLVSR